MQNRSVPPNYIRNPNVPHVPYYQQGQPGNYGTYSNIPTYHKHSDVGFYQLLNKPRNELYQNEPFDQRDCPPGTYFNPGHFVEHRGRTEYIPSRCVPYANADYDANERRGIFRRAAL